MFGRVTFFLLVVILAGCSGSGPTTSEEPMNPDVTLNQASAEVARLLSLVTSQDIDPEPDSDEKIGCRTDPKTLMPAGPPWKLRRTWWVRDPSSELVAATIRRLESLTAEGFEPIPWTRPDPEPATLRGYRDNRGYVISIDAEPSPPGPSLLQLRVTSPCVGE